MSSTPEAIEVYQSNGFFYGSAKAANAGGIAVISALEMSQNSMRYSWAFEEVDEKLKEIMSNIYRNCCDSAKKCGMEDNLVAGANCINF
ncbi:MAG: hypothetical protein ACLVKR_08600 [Lachnospiraceae bacterium]